MKQNQEVLFLLREPFSNTFQPLPIKNKMKNFKNIYTTEENPKNSELDLETNDDDYETIKIGVFEERMHNKLEILLKKFGGF